VLHNPVIKDHFLHPRGMKRISAPTFQAAKKSTICNDVVRVSLIIDESGIVSDIGTEVYGCGYSIAGASILNECARNCNIEQVKNKFETIIQSVSDDVPERNRYCLNLAMEVFTLLYEQYKNKE
jgi:NifU-like protein involved in Fe-S cluster formation